MKGVSASGTESRKKDRIVIFLRHGESTKNVEGRITSAIDGYPLTDYGMKQAKAAARRLAAMPRINALYTSPILRARQTADIVGQRIHLVPVVDMRLRERGWGTLEEKSEPGADDIWKFNPKYRIEPWERLKDKMAAFMEGLGPGVSVAVTHGDNMTSACSVIDGKDERSCQSSLPATCHFCIIDVGNRLVIECDSTEIPEEVIERSRQV